MNNNAYNFIDLTNKKFGKLTVLKRVENRIAPNGHRIPQWECQCDCGKVIVTSGRSLRDGKQDCGCVPYHKKVKRKGNHYDLTGEFGIGYTFDNKEFWFDLEDYEKIKDLTWNYEGNYVVTTYGGKDIRLHRLVMGLDTIDATKQNNNKIHVDHICHDPDKNPLLFDNRKSNLRIVTPSQNGQNKALQSNNTSGHPGVSWDKHNKKWQTYIDINRKRIFLGRYKNFEDALKVRTEAEK